MSDTSLPWTRVTYTLQRDESHVRRVAGEPRPIAELNHYYQTMVARPDTMSALDSLIAGLFDFVHGDWVERNTTQ